MVVVAEIRTPGLAFHVLYVTSGRMSCSILYLQQNVPGLVEGGCSLSDLYQLRSISSFWMLCNDVNVWRPLLGAFKGLV